MFHRGQTWLHRPQSATMTWHYFLYEVLTQIFIHCTCWIWSIQGPLSVYYYIIWSYRATYSALILINCIIQNCIPVYWLTFSMLQCIYLLLSLPYLVCLPQYIHNFIHIYSLVYYYYIQLVLADQHIYRWKLNAQMSYTCMHVWCTWCGHMGEGGRGAFQMTCMVSQSISSQSQTPHFNFYLQDCLAPPNHCMPITCL